MKTKFFFFFFLCCSSLQAQTGWFLLSSAQEYGNADIAFPSVDTGYVFGSYGFMEVNFLKVTVDGGSSWNTVKIPNKFYPYHPFFLNSKTFFFFDGDSAILKTTNGGKVWEKNLILDTSLKNVSSIFFVNPAIGF